MPTGQVSAVAGVVSVPLAYHLTACEGRSGSAVASDSHSYNAAMAMRAAAKTIDAATKSRLLTVVLTGGPCGGKSSSLTEIMDKVNQRSSNPAVAILPAPRLAIANEGAADCLGVFAVHCRGI
jgi:hypothetical protein